MRPETNDKLRFRARTFNDLNYPQVVYIPTYKKCKYMLNDNSILIYLVTIRAST